MFTGSKKQLLDLIKQKGTISIDEAVENTDLAKTTLREHFLQLERDEYIQRDYVRSGPGRPSLEYQLTQKGNSLFPSYESAMIKELLNFLKSQGDEETIERFFESFWDERFEKAQRRMDEASEEDTELRLQALTKMLEEEGFMPKITRKDNQVTIRECNCPFPESVKQTRIPCQLEAAFYEALFGAEVERSHYIPDGHPACTYQLAPDQVREA